jgi:16S rRNA (cytidine1402-2'-O)-methyltransferase
MAADPAGVLHVVATPIGNLGDITLRAVEVLRAADEIVAEDTRRTRALLTHLGISGKPLSKLDANATPDDVARVVERLRQGRSIALVTDAGMPTLSDPGSELVRQARKAGAGVTPIPGPSAVTAAAAASGLVDGAFTFLGFLPRRGAKRARAIDRICSSTEPVVLFESPQRVAETLSELAERIPERSVFVAREMTKLHEELFSAPLGELAREPREWRGEVTLVVEAVVHPDEEVDPAAIDDAIRDRLSRGASAKSIATDLARATGLPKREVYARVLRLWGDDA